MGLLLTCPGSELHIMGKNHVSKQLCAETLEGFLLQSDPQVVFWIYFVCKLYKFN